VSYCHASTFQGFRVKFYLYFPEKVAMLGLKYLVDEAAFRPGSAPWIYRFGFLPF
jgi:hypothetical protein